MTDEMRAEYIRMMADEIGIAAIKLLDGDRGFREAKALLDGITGLLYIQASRVESGLPIGSVSVSGK
jgi:hypothetical protein